ncbi:hypothetical protein CN568_13400 [Bacillus pseudomycoides]|uniref:hypothetical protein n=1 Tax=Bacillus pseudomycoides TaxID=64104 RepID=UPI000BF847AB|nr:hypothetical protein [Bacillus pseudomycoides]MED1621374.1 hypothetical protein [Bacillus pseudomycoides]PEP42554.1 hypothetical protein CN565_09685 [Bacillus pseudomycoides]PEP44208.1 hypothetical protein CN568_13400 [Bacillus pseudomycoides]
MSTLSGGLFFGEIKKDYEEFIKLFSSNELNELGLDQDYKVLHKKVYIFKELLNECEIADTTALSYSLDTLGSLIEYIHLLSQHRYKLAASLLRGSMETFAKALIHISSLRDSNGFTNNIELAVSKISQDYIVNFLKLTRNKPLKTTIGNAYREVLKNLYWNLCDIVHSRDTTYNHCYEYLESILNNEFEESKYRVLYDYAILLLDKMLVIFYIQNMETINKNMNEIKLEYIISQLESDYHQIFRTQ